MQTQPELSLSPGFKHRCGEPCEEPCGEPLRLLWGEGVCWGEVGAAYFLFVAPS